MNTLNTQTLAHEQTRSFSKLVNAYLAGAEDLKSFYHYSPSLDGARQAIEARKQFPVNRKVLVEVLKEQYEDYELSPEFETQIQLLKSENTFTVCTAHQPDLMAGYLYFFYKIIHAARLADYLKEQFPENHFVPVFYIGSEDNDFEELSVFNYDNKPYRWFSNQKGAVGRMNTADLLPLIEELKEVLVPYGVNRDRLIEVITTAYDGTKTIAQAIRHIVHEFMGKLGVVVLDADDSRLKKQYIEVMRSELMTPQSLQLVTPVSEALSAQYQAQAYARSINLFYLKDGLRARIEREDALWKVVHTDIAWDTEAALLQELETHPERFSPNVILRGPYQEIILPDVAFIGGGSEVAYWMQLQKLFEHYGIFFPILVLRQSALWMPKAATKLQQKLGLENADMFLPTDELKNEYARKLGGEDLQLTVEVEELNRVLDNIQSKVEQIDVTLVPASKAVKAKIAHLTHRLEKKMLRAQKRRLSDRMRQIDNLKSLIAPKGKLQERQDCFLQLYLDYGENFVDYQYQQTLPWGDRFLLIKDE